MTQYQRTGFTVAQCDAVKESAHLLLVPMDIRSRIIEKPRRFELNVIEITLSAVPYT
jgi:hypothetical protein